MAKVPVRRITGVTPVVGNSTKKNASVAIKMPRKAPLMPMKSVVATQSSYAGASKPINSSKSKTEVDVSRFGLLADQPITDRDFLFITDLKREFGLKTFARGNFDAGCIKRAGERGYLTYVDGELATTFCRFKLTSRAQTLGRKAA